VRFWLALAGRSEPAVAGVTRPLFQVAERLMRVIELARDVRVMEDRVRRGELLAELLDDRRAREVSLERLELFGFSPAGPLLRARGDALLALDFLQRMGAVPGRVLCFEEFEFIDALLAAADPAQLRARTRLVLDPLRAHPQLFETLVTYLAADLNVNEAAERL